MAVALLDGVAWYAGLLLDDRSLMAVALTLCIVWGLALLCTMAQSVMLRLDDLALQGIACADADDQGQTGRRRLGRLMASVAARRAESRWTPVAAHGRIRRWLLPRGVRACRQFVQLDQDDTPVGIHRSTLPRMRGWYRCVSVTARWHGPFSLFAATRIIPDGTGVAVLPEATQPSSGVRAVVADKRLKGQAQTENAGTVREYAPGDSPRLISWSQSAHRGHLMVRETGRDVRSTLVVVLDVRDPGTTQTQADAQAREAAPLLEPSLGGARGRTVIVTDGVHVANDTGSAMRLLAACRPIADDGPADNTGVANDPRARTTGGETDDETRRVNNDETRHTQASRYAHAVAGLCSERSGAVTVLLLTAQPQGDLAQALRASVPERLRVVQVETPAEPPQRYAVTVMPETAVCEPSEMPAKAAAYRSASPGTTRRNAWRRFVPQRLPKTGRADATRPGTSSPASALSGESSPGRTALGVSSSGVSSSPSPLASGMLAVCLMVCFALALQPLTAIVSVGWWTWLAAASLALASIACAIPVRRPRMLAVRIAAFIVAQVVALAVLVLIRLHGELGFWLFAVPAAPDVQSQTASGVSIATSAQSLADVSPWAGSSPWAVLTGVASQGLDALLVQLPPVQVDAAGDVDLMMVTALAVIAVRLMLCSRRVAPLMALLPAFGFAARFAFVGTVTPWWQLGVLVAAFVLLLWSSSTLPVRVPLPLGASAVVTAMVLSLTPSAVNLALDVPLSLGESKGLLSSNTINPMIDLKRSVTSGSDSTVLSYVASQRLYLRMTTLDDFNGDTWSFDKDLTKKAGLYGSGIQLGRNKDANDTDWQVSRRQLQQLLVNNPALYYPWLMSGGGNLGSDDPSALTYTFSDSSDDSPWMASAQVTIEGLRTRFLPVSGLPVATIVKNGWKQYSDGTIYSPDATTQAEQRYTAAGLYYEPITSDKGFDQITGVTDTRQKLIDMTVSETTPWSERTSLRRQWAAQGLGEIHGNWLAIPLDVSQYGTAKASDGTIIGMGHRSLTSVEDSSYDSYDIDTFSDMSRERLGISDDDVIALASSPKGFLMLIPVSETDALDRLMSEDDADAYQSIYDDMEAVATGMGYGDSGFSTRSGTSRQWAPFTENDLNKAFARIAANEKTIRSHYLSLPDDLPQNVRSLVARAKREGTPTTGDDADQQIAAMRWLVDYFTNKANNFVYSLDAPDGNGRDNMAMIDTFLDQHAGYCAHYASALAVLGRAMGVPTRMVMGYHKGVGNPTSTVSTTEDFWYGSASENRYDVAAKQLHAWVEAYIDGVGWVPFDVTPASTSNGSAESASSSSSTTSTNTQAKQQAEQSQTTQQQNAQKKTTTQQSTKTTAKNTASAATPKTGATMPVLPRWAAVALWTAFAMLLTGLLAATPALLRRRRRRRALALIAAAGKSRNGAGSEPPGPDSGPDAASAVGGGSRRGRRAGSRKTGGNAGNSTGGSTGGKTRRAWFAAWQEILDTAYDARVRWNDSDTERAIAELVTAGPKTVRHERHDVETAPFGNSGEPTRNLPQEDRELIMQACRQVTAIAFGGRPAVPDEALAERLRTFCLHYDAMVRRRLTFPQRMRRRLLPPSLLRRRR
ncbi:transglutaminaseTgpA domain-containing protein [Bifidobacterium leontopitheci]|uniref:Transglutaminase-like superfamily n=1 Tax=Bifidobacterium leontopitheci TaxID=2650774 RepID=A0A6I1GRX4_9BIFI|nr:transglutaminaseTgpA domain-containing protein [Bifidobacterium leontopitheci]KAB7790908.1 Transglutaminase-like superfamily [Bifidobacterium leontopitheci]